MAGGLSALFGAKPIQPSNGVCLPSACSLRVRVEIAAQRAFGFGGTSGALQGGAAPEARVFGERRGRLSELAPVAAGVGSTFLDGCRSLFAAAPCDPHRIVDSHV
jgi:hypothetical protein